MSVCLCVWWEYVSTVVFTRCNVDTDTMAGGPTEMDCVCVCECRIRGCWLMWEEQTGRSGECTLTRQRWTAWHVLDARQYSCTLYSHLLWVLIKGHFILFNPNVLRFLANNNVLFRPLDSMTYCFASCSGLWRKLEFLALGRSGSDHEGLPGTWFAYGSEHVQIITPPVDIQSSCLYVRLL